MMRKSVLVIGGGGREHTLAWKLRQSPEVGDLYVAPGNAGTASPLAQAVPLPATDLDGIVRLAAERDVYLTVIGPEAPLALGLADRLRAAGRLVVGPDRAAARIESSKAFAKGLMQRAGVPTAAYRVFDDPSSALTALQDATYPVVVKVDGLAAGKGVTVCAGSTAAREAVVAAMVDRIHGSAGNRLVIEEALTGPEVSLQALVDGEWVVPLPLAQDHKRLGDGDIGPNTGGMGAYAPLPFLDRAQQSALSRLVLEPVAAALAAQGTPFHGVLYAGLMLTADGPRVLEFNCRLGDPETQVILPLLSGDLFPWLEAVAAGRLQQLPAAIPVSSQHAVGVVLAAPGYPAAPEVGAPISLPTDGTDQPDDAQTLIFHAGTARDAAGHVITAGGRVLTVVGRGETIDQAAARAYAVPVTFPGMQRRHDIAWQARQFLNRAVTVPSVGEGAQIQEAGSPTPPRFPRIGVLVSGEGSNLQALLDACESGIVDARVAVVVSHREGAGALERARQAAVPACVLPQPALHDPLARCRYEVELLALLLCYRLDLAVLAGWLLVLSADFLDRCPFPLLNVHPALLPEPGELPDYPVLRGMHAVRDALALRLPYTGVSVHHVTVEVDAGPVVRRERVPIAAGDDEASLYRRIKAVEHRLLPEAVQSVLTSMPGGVYA